MKAATSRILYIDLAKKKSWTEYRRDLVEEWVGGVGVAVGLFEEEGAARADPLGPENPIILAVGPLNAAYPMASKTVAMFRSPLTGNLGESYAGGRSSSAIKLAGYLAIVIRGASEHPVYVAVHGDNVHFRDARALWGMSSSVTVGRVIREREPGSGIRTIMRIGPAGENLVKYACVVTETFRHFGRLGLGAVFGSKRLKAVLVSGRRALEVADRVAYRKVYDEIFQQAVESDLMDKYHMLGTPMSLLPLNAMGALPTRNLSSNSFELAEEISGESMAKNVLARRVACVACPVACIHVAALREPYVGEPYFYKTTFTSYDYEPIYALGSMLGIGDRRGLLKLIDEVEATGVDAISTGVCLAWATEALQRGIIRESDAILNLRWGDYESYRKAVRLITKQSNDFYRALAGGTRHASERYGGGEFALNFGGNEMPGYHTGPAAYLGFLTGGRHSHLDSAGYSIDQAAKELPSPQEVVEQLVEEESRRMVLNSLIVCLFARKIYSMELISRALEPLGMPIPPEGLERLGRDVYRKRYSLKAAMGFKLDDLRIPDRVFEAQTPHGLLSQEYFRKALQSFASLLQREGVSL